MKKFLFFLVLVLTTTVPCRAQTDCALFDKMIESNLKLIASERAEGISDNSAPRETMRVIKINNYLQVINMNLMLMKEAKCSLRKKPITMGEYMKEALECQLAQMKGEKDSPACKMESWKGVDADPKPVATGSEEKPSGPK